MAPPAAGYPEVSGAERAASTSMGPLACEWNTMEYIWYDRCGPAPPPRRSGTAWVPRVRSLGSSSVARISRNGRHGQRAACRDPAVGFGAQPAGGRVRPRSGRAAASERGRQHNQPARGPVSRSAPRGDGWVVRERGACATPVRTRPPSGGRGPAWRTRADPSPAKSGRGRSECAPEPPRLWPWRIPERVVPCHSLPFPWRADALYAVSPGDAGMERQVAPSQVALVTETWYGR